MNRQIQLLALATSVAVLLVSPAWALTESFDGPVGLVVSGLQPDGNTAPGTFFAGFTVTVFNNDGPNSCVIFDTENPTTEDDFDLGTPNESCGGPGIGSGGTCDPGNCGSRGSNGQNCVALGKALIISENLDGSGDTVDSPDDDRDGGKIIFEFDETFVPLEITILDIDDETAVVNLDGETLSVEVAATDLGNNSAQTLDLQGLGTFDRLEVTFSSSGAVAEISYDTVINVKPNRWGGIKTIYRE